MIQIKGRVPSKKNSRRIVHARGRIMSLPSKSYMTWVKDAKEQVIAQGKFVFNNIDNVVLEFYFPDKRKTDLTNKAESIMDMLVDCSILQDDSWQYVPKLTLIAMGVDRKNPRVNIIIT